MVSKEFREASIKNWDLLRYMMKDSKNWELVKPVNNCPGQSIDNTVADGYAYKYNEDGTQDVIIMEVKVRKKLYDTLVLEFDKYKYLHTKCDELKSICTLCKNFTILYINLIDDVIYIWSIKDVEYEWIMKPMKFQTLGDDRLVLKKATMLPILDAKQIRFDNVKFNEYLKKPEIEYEKR